MARVIYGGGVDEFVGSIGGSTFQKNKSGNIVRSKPQIRKRRTPLQVIQLSGFSSLSNYYRSIDAGYKLNWISYADTFPHVDYWNVSRIVTSVNWFTIINSLRLRDGNSILDDTPAYTLPSPLSSFALSIVGSDLVIDSASPLGSSTEICDIWVTGPQLHNTSVNRKAWKYLMSVQADISLPFTITTEWENLFNLSLVDSVITPTNYVFAAISKHTVDECIPDPFIITYT